ncbi:MAG TPA: glycoside hydrolase [Acidocella sp.]|jgi:exo-beta-1,3-glucanase (GH17 family)|uniref:glycoside hydrolase n=1 Tax=Acidocella sp. TaxID=50710 RepID=UPI002BE78D19|nr:glycoside hydrolase [Acidocella sp.]HVE22449.1 glycoside hydrolase [Acidocella sp.]
MKRGLLACALLSALTFFLWAGPNEPQAGDVTMPAGKFQSLSYAPGRARQVEADLRLIATQADGIRTASAREGNIAALAKQAGLKLWLGIRLGADPQDNAKEIAAGIAAANAYPGTVTRVVVGSEVLRRGDLPVNELIADIDEMRARVKQPVSYADSPAIWRKFPQVAAHVDVVTVDFVPYREGRPLDVDASLAGIRATIASFRQRFPDKEISVGAAGWPSRGRWRKAAAPSRVNEAVFWRNFVTFAHQDKVDYNLTEAFDRNGAYQDTGVAGASWGLWTAQRALKFPLQGPVVEHPDWRWYAALGALMGSLLFGAVGFRNPRLAVPAFMLGNGFAIACIGTLPVLYDDGARLAAAVNLPLQAVFAFMVIRRADAMLSGAQPQPKARHLFSYESLWFAFLAGAALSQALLVFDGRYRDAPLPAFIIPAIAALFRLWTKDLPRASGWVEMGAACALALLAIADVGIEGAKNLDFVTWNLAALLLAAPVLMGRKEALLFVNKK